MNKILIFCCLVIVKAPKHIGFYECKLKKLIKIKNVIFIENNTTIGNDFKMCKSRRNEGPMMVVMVKSFKSPFFHGGEDIKIYGEWVEYKSVANQEAMKRPTNDVNIK